MKKNTISRKKKAVSEISILFENAGINFTEIKMSDCLARLSEHDLSVPEFIEHRVLAPFPYFGGKRNVSDVVWQHFGANIPNYIEPFAGGAAVLLARPHPARVITENYRECVNDKDALVINVWRAIKLADPLKLAAAVENLNSQQQLTGQSCDLIRRRQTLNRLVSNYVEHFDFDLAAQWIWVMRSAIAAGLANPAAAAARRKASPRARLSGWSLGSPEKCFDYLRQRLRNVEMQNCDWLELVSSRTKTVSQGTTGVFLDPPYPNQGRSANCYGEDDGKVAYQAAEWAVKTVTDDRQKLFRIAFCGYFDRHDTDFPASWTRYRWAAKGGYAVQGNGRGRQNAAMETIWFSPNCLPAAN